MARRVAAVSSMRSPRAILRPCASLSPAMSPPCCRTAPTKGVSPVSPRIDPPLALLAELTHRCPLRCPYCSNPVELSRASAELDTAAWKRVFTQAAGLGVLQVHFSGGEPLVRRDLADLVRHAA